MAKSYFRCAVDAMSGYVPGEQPQVNNLIKLNTNENPYPPSPRVAAALAALDYTELRRYPNPMADRLRDLIGEIHGVTRANVLAANGSDDVLTLVFRAFTSPGQPLVCFEPTYSLYPTLAAMQEAPVVRLALDDRHDFALPDNYITRAAGSNLAILTRPNAPTGNSFPLAQMEEFCRRFDGVVLFDEAYADFADDNCMELAKRYSNVLVSRTLSKSYSLAGLRLGYVVGNPVLIDGLMKLKDSYNVDRPAQELAMAALSDREYLAATTAKIVATRERFIRKLRALEFHVVPSQTNFVFAMPPSGEGREWFEYLRANAVVTRYFPGPVTGRFVRVSVGTDTEMDRVLELTRLRYVKKF